MDITITPRQIRGEINAIPSKSIAHRMLICAAFAQEPTELICPETNQDIEATVDCLRALSADILPTENGYTVIPIGQAPTSASLNCRESGSTLRFLLPLVGAMGVDCTFGMEGRLPRRPLSPLWEEMERMGCKLEFISENELQCTGKLCPGEYYIDGHVSSQFITGLLFATSLMDGDSKINITGKLESAPYVAMTQKVMALFGVNTENFCIKGGQQYHSPGNMIVEGDWSNGAFFLAAQAMGNPVRVKGLSTDSAQGDKVIEKLLPALRQYISLSAADIPDLVPILSVVAAANEGAVFTDIQRLRLKESDRVASVVSMINALGGKAEQTESTLTVYGTGLTGGTVDSMNDHRIAMAAAIAATVCSEPVTVLGADCVKKSYPSFWEEYGKLGGQYEQYLR